MNNLYKIIITLLVIAFCIPAYSQVGSSRRKRKTETTRSSSIYKTPTSSNSSSNYRKPGKREKKGWMYKMPKGNFIIQSAMNYKRGMKGCWDVPGRRLGNLARKDLKLWNKPYNDNDNDRFYNFEKSYSTYFFIHPRYNKYVSVDVNGGQFKNGQNIQLWESNGSKAQKFQFYHLGGGRFRIYTADSRYVFTAQNRQSHNGSNIHIWKNENGIYQEWYILNKYSKKAYIPYK